jgi:hypothetical protein
LNAKERKTEGMNSVYTRDREGKWCVPETVRLREGR